MPLPCEQALCLASKYMQLLVTYGLHLITKLLLRKRVTIEIIADQLKTTARLSIPVTAARSTFWSTWLQDSLPPAISPKSLLSNCNHLHKILYTLNLGQPPPGHVLIELTVLQNQSPGLYFSQYENRGLLFVACIADSSSDSKYSKQRRIIVNNGEQLGYSKSRRSAVAWHSITKKVDGDERKD